jgi:hypothetical protein
MEILSYTSILFVLGGLFSMLLLLTNPYYKNKISKAIDGFGRPINGLDFSGDMFRLNVAYEIALHKAEQLEILKHKWFESEKVGYDIGFETAQESWDKYHAQDWRRSKKKAA